GPVIGEQLLQPGEPAFTHVPDGHADQETVKQRFQLGLLRKFIRSAEERDQRSLRGLTPVLELAFVHQPQQVVQDRRRGFESLVEEGEFDVGQLPGRDALVVIGLQPADRDRAEEFLRRGELREQVDEASQPAAGRVADPFGEFDDEHRFGRSGRADQRPVLPWQKREQHGAYDLLAFDEERAQFGFDCAQLTERFIDGCRIGHYEWLRLIVIDGWWGPDQLSRPCERNRSFFAARTVSARKKLSSICGQSRSKASGSTPGWELKRLRANSFQYATISSTKATRSAVSGVLAGFCLSSIAVSPPRDTAMPPAPLLSGTQFQSKLNWALERDAARRFGRGRFSRSALICSRRANSSSQSAVVLAAPVSIAGCPSTPFPAAVGAAASIRGSWL